MDIPEKDTEEASNIIRCEYRCIRDKLQENRLLYTDPNNDAIENTLENIQEVFKKVKKPREAVSDSKVLLELAILGKERIRNVQCVFRQFNNGEYINKLKNFMKNLDKRTVNVKRSESDEDIDGPDSPDRNRNRKPDGNKSYVLTKSILSKFGLLTMGFFRLPPKPTFLLGSLDKELLMTQKKIRQRRTALDNSDEEKRTKIKELDADSNENETNSTVNEIDRIFKCLKKFHKKLNGDPICFYEFSINPNSFSRTIENIFYISFLVKDGYVKIYLDADNLPVIEPVLGNEAKSFTSDPNRKKTEMQNIQSMISLSQIEWKQIIKTFGIEKAAIPDPK